MPGPVIVVEHGRNKAAREHPWSTMVRMASFPLILGKPVIRSMAICWNGRESSGVVMQYRGILGRCVRFYFVDTLHTRRHNQRPRLSSLSRPDVSGLVGGSRLFQGVLLWDDRG